jgi:hypothetical protein
MLDERRLAVTPLLEKACGKCGSLALGEFGIPQNELDAHQFISFY